MSYLSQRRVFVSTAQPLKSNEKADFQENIKKNGLENLLVHVKDDLDKCNEIILDKLHSSVPLIPELAKYIIAAGGKRLRPLITLASARLCGYQGTRQIPLAACVEFIHTATLLHDDVVDESHLRRGLSTANTVWGNQASVLVGDFLFSRSFEMMVADGSLKVLKILSQASAIIAEGEVHQLVTQNDIETSEQDYLKVIDSKTARLFAAAAEIGAVVAEKSEEEQKALETYGRSLGIVFQLVDDILDYRGRDDRLGKGVGDDFKEGKMTLPVIVALSKATATELDFWKKTLGDLNQEEDDFVKAYSLIQGHEGFEYTYKKAQEYAHLAKEALQIFPESELKTAMTDIVDFSLNRLY